MFQLDVSFIVWFVGPSPAKSLATAYKQGDIFFLVVLSMFNFYGHAQEKFIQEEMETFIINVYSTGLNVHITNSYFPLMIKDHPAFYIRIEDEVASDTFIVLMERIFNIKDYTPIDKTDTIFVENETLSGSLFIEFYLRSNNIKRKVCFFIIDTGEYYVNNELNLKKRDDEMMDFLQLYFPMIFIK